MAKKILIVEDNELNMKLFADLLEAAGFEILKSPDGSDAIDLARRHQPDLILMDIQLPKVSGVDLTIMMKADSDVKDIPVIAVTAFAMKGDRENIMQHGFAEYVPKPIDVPKFLAAVYHYT